MRRRMGGEEDGWRRQAGEEEEGRHGMARQDREASLLSIYHRQRRGVHSAAPDPHPLSSSSRAFSISVFIDWWATGRQGRQAVVQARQRAGGLPFPSLSRTTSCTAGKQEAFRQAGGSGGRWEQDAWQVGIPLLH